MSLNITNDTCTERFSKGYILAMQVAIGCTCALSLLGGALIIFTYVAYRDLRTLARQLLVNLTIADILISGSHLFGLAYNFQREENITLSSTSSHHLLSAMAHFHSAGLRSSSPCENNTTEVILSCKLQAGVTVFGTIASFLWTISMAAYLFALIVAKSRRVSKVVAVVSYPVCWCVPLVIVCVFVGESKFGYFRIADTGWCYLAGDDRATEVVGYDLWSYLAIVLLPLLYILIRCHVKIKLIKIKGLLSLRLQSAVKLADLKLMFIPLIFLLLRMWSFIIDIPLFYIMDQNLREKFIRYPLTKVLIFLAGVGNSAQGFVNAILFCLFTRLVREKLTQCCWRKRDRRGGRGRGRGGGGGEEEEEEDEEEESCGDMPDSPTTEGSDEEGSAIDRKRKSSSSKSSRDPINESLVHFCQGSGKYSSLNNTTALMSNSTNTGKFSW